MSERMTPEQTHCPITGERLLNPGQTVSHTALQDLTNKTNRLCELHHDLRGRISGEGRPDREVHARTVPSSKPPLSVGLLDTVTENEDTLLVWAVAIMQHVLPAWTMPAPFRWSTIETIYQQKLLSLTQWAEAPYMIPDVTDAVANLERAAEWVEPKQIRSTLDDLPDTWMTVTGAVNAVKHATGVTLPRTTIYSWERDGKLQSRDDPKKYSMRDILLLVDERV